MRLSSHDASFLYTETASGPMHGVAITTLDGTATYEEIFDYYAARIHMVPRLRQRLMFVPFNLAHPKWADDPDFRLENHIKRHTVKPGTTLDQAREIALELGEGLLDRTRPLWLTYVIEGVEGKTLLAQMSHHAFVDGATAVAMSIVLTDMTPEGEEPTQAPEWNPAPLPSQRELWFEALEERARGNLATMVNNLAPGAFKLELWWKGAALMNRMAIPVMQAPWNASLVGPKRKVTMLEYTLDDFRPIRKALGGTVNDAVIAVVSEGAARYLAGRGEFVTSQYLRLMCPVNVRDADVDPMDLEGNRVSAMFPMLPAWPMDVVDRHKVVRAELDGIKSRGEPETMDAMLEAQESADPSAMATTQAVGTPWDPTAASARWPAPVLPHIGPRPLQGGFNFTCTNVPGPTWTQYVAGYEVEGVMGGMMLGGNLGLGVSVGSFGGTFTFSFTADPRLMPDLQQFVDHVADAFRELSAVAVKVSGAEAAPEAVEVAVEQEAEAKTADALDTRQDAEPEYSVAAA